MLFQSELSKILPLRNERYNGRLSPLFFLSSLFSYFPPARGAHASPQNQKETLLEAKIPILVMAFMGQEQN
jgi:hypothetical protein